LSTRGSEKARQVAAAVGTAAALYALLTAGLQLACRHLEADRGVYTFWHEDYLRLMLPHLYEGRGNGRIFLAGSSEAREAFLVERFAPAFPGEAPFAGGMNGSSLSDFLLSMDYIGRNYGGGAVPRVIVLGITPRYVSDIEAGFDAADPEVYSSPMVPAIDRYSPSDRVESSSGEPRLVPKSAAGGLAARLRFLGKQQARYRAVLAYLAATALPDSGTTRGLGRRAAQRLRPYRVNFLPALPDKAKVAAIRNDSKTWRRVFGWEPAADEGRIRRQFAAIRSFARWNGVELYVVNLPELVWARDAYDPGRYAAYRRVVAEALAETPFLDLRECVPPEGFQDTDHVTYAAAERVSDRVVAFIKAQRARAADVAGRAGGGP
jgi:hypothetical protein